VVGQICFFVFVIVCVALHPGIVLKANEGGISNYGVHLKTALPYTLSLFLLSAYFLRAANYYVGASSVRRCLRIILTGYAGIVFAELLSTYSYTLNTTLKDIHFGIGTVLIVWVAAASVWMYGLERHRRWTNIFIAIQLTGSVLAILCVAGTLHVLFAAEMIIDVGFAPLLIQTCRDYGVE